ncbi:uncharacterized protein LOC143230476 [Tachypleus tridentatus]|uniref:uncharacterized protein LOC143230476 n=1 Tax=Tachypleus tridentatus TaxID=6853 RepID=UPI003FD16D49
MENYLAVQNNTTKIVDDIPAGHKAILEMHANSQSNAIIYVMVVLLLYALALVIVMIKYIRTERYESRLTHLYDEFVRRDRFIRLSKRQPSMPATSALPTDGEEDSVVPTSSSSRCVRTTTEDAVSKV